MASSQNLVPEMVHIAAGVFWMGALDWNKVYLDEYWISKYPVTEGQFTQLFEQFGNTRETTCLNQDLQDETIPQHNTPLENPEQEGVTAVEVIDPAHPLFGRKFPVIYSSTRSGVQNVSVLYREQVTLWIPRSATNLVPAQPRVTTKLTIAAMQELLSVAEAEAEEVQCQSSRETSGSNCPPKCKPKFLPNSQSHWRK
jgi:hypothetical protein